MVFPVPVRDRAGLDPAHIQVIVNEMGEHIVQAAALVGHLEADADLFRVPAENGLVRHNQETGAVLPALVDALLQHLQSPLLRSQGACDGRLGLIAVLRHLFGSQGRVEQAYLPPVPVAVQVLRALHEPLGMGIDGPDIGKLRVRRADQGVPDGKDLNEAKDVDAGNQGAAVDTTAQSVTEADSSAVSAVVEPEKDPCEDIENALRAREDSQTHQAVAEDDCNGKIEIQARDHSLHTEFWDNRNRHFLGDDLTDALYGLFEGDKPVLNLENFEGIDNKEEFVYKYAIMKANNMPEQRMLVDLIEKACGGQLTEGDYIDIARGMNSYDNHGNPLCWENTSDVVSGRLPDDVERCDPVEPVEISVEPVPVEQVPAETVVEDTTKKFYQGYIEEHVKLGSVQSQELIKGYDYDFHDAPIPENEPAEGYDYDVDGNVGEPTPNVKSEMVTGLINMANGGRVAYNFHDGAAVIDYTMPEDAETSKIAAHLEGFSDQPDIQARRYAAYGEVYFDLQNRLAEGETIKGAEEWMGWMDKHLAKRGLFIDENGYVAINQNADREMLLEAYQADPNALMTDKEINEIKKSAISMAQMKNNGYSR